jgi:hypothetical protein
MNFQRVRIHDINKLVIETVYENFESDIVRFCVAEKTDAKTNCVFYGADNAKKYSIELPTELSYRHEVPINRAGDKIFPFDDGKIACYALVDGEKLWEKKVKNINGIFEYRDKLYCVQSEVGFIILNAETGEQISKTVCFKKGYCTPNIFRINERYLIFYDADLCLFDMDNCVIIRSDFDLKVGEQRDLISAELWDDKDFITLEFVNWIKGANEFETDERCVKTTIYLPLALLVEHKK